jgi:hypothetical protein
VCALGGCGGVIQCVCSGWCQLQQQMKYSSKSRQHLLGMARHRSLLGMPSERPPPHPPPTHPPAHPAPPPSHISTVVAVMLPPHAQGTTYRDALFAHSFSTDVAPSQEGRSATGGYALLWNNTGVCACVCLCVWGGGAGGGRGQHSTEGRSAFEGYALLWNNTGTGRGLGVNTTHVLTFFCLLVGRTTPTAVGRRL